MLLLTESKNITSKTCIQCVCIAILQSRIHHKLLRFLPQTDGDFIQFWPRKGYGLSYEDEQQESATTSALPCSVNTSAAGQQLVTSSAGTIQIQPGYDVIAEMYSYNARRWRQHWLASNCTV